jgi:hypothetical protein
MGSFKETIPEYRLILVSVSIPLRVMIVSREDPRHWR